MSANIINKVLLVTGLGSLVHAAFSAAHHRTYLRLTEQDWTTLPVDIVAQIVISLIIVIYNLIQIVGNFKEIRATVDMQERSWDTLANFSSFYSFNHRGKALSPHFKTPEMPTTSSATKSSLETKREDRY